MYSFTVKTGNYRRLRVGDVIWLKDDDEKVEWFKSHSTLDEKDCTKRFLMKHHMELGNRIVSDAVEQELKAELKAEQKPEVKFPQRWQDLSKFKLLDLIRALDAYELGDEKMSKQNLIRKLSLIKQIKKQDAKLEKDRKKQKTNKEQKK